jgi:hypothetical protein
MRASAEAKAASLPPYMLRLPVTDLESHPEWRALWLNWLNETMHAPQRLTPKCVLYPLRHLHENVDRAPGMYCESDLKSGETLPVTVPQRKPSAQQQPPMERPVRLSAQQVNELTQMGLDAKRLAGNAAATLGRK